MTSKNRPKVLYILGVGHSGSTLLDLLLGTASNAVSVGELRFLNNYVRKERQRPGSKNKFLCACGKPLPDCSFWSPIIRKLVLPKQAIRDNLLQDRIRPVLHVYFPWVRVEPSPLDDKKLYRLLLDRRKGTEWIIDSSKHLRRLIYLQEHVDVDLTVLHLVRDGRGVIKSHEKAGYRWPSALINWFVGNWVMRAYCKRRFKGKYLSLSYDRFCENPDATLALLSKRLGLVLPKEYVKAINATPSHTFGGNRLQRRKIDRIVCDDSWKKAFPFWKRSLLSFLTWLPNKRWVAS